MDRRAWQATVRGVGRIRHDLVTKPPQKAICLRSYQFKQLIGCECKKEKEKNLAKEISLVSQYKNNK